MEGEEEEEVEEAVVVVCVPSLAAAMFADCMPLTVVSSERKAYSDRKMLIREFTPCFVALYSGLLLLAPRLLGGEKNEVCSPLPLLW